ncbi:zinc finger, CCHC-type containing protein [Tanacetum coccineum]
MVVTAMSVMSVLTTPVPEDGENATVEQIRNRAKWDNDDYDSLEAKYMAEDALSKKFFVSNFTNYKMSDSRPIMEQYNELFGILGRFTQHKMNMDEAIQDEGLDKFKVFKTKVELQQGSLIKRFRTDRGGEYMDTLYFQSVGIIHEMTALYTPQQNGIFERKNRVLKEMVNSMLSYSGLSQGAVVRLPDPKLKTLGERGIEYIFVGYAEHSKAFRFYLIEPNDSDSINFIIESRDAIFDENRFSSVPRPSLRIPNGTKDIGGLVVPKEVTKEAEQGMSPMILLSRKEAINDETDSIIGNNTWVLADLAPGCKPLGCKWIFKIKLKVDGTIEKFKVRLVIQGFKQKSGIEYFDTYAPVALISTIRLLIAIALIHNLIIHQMDVKTAFLNGELDEETSWLHHAWQ